MEGEKLMSKNEMAMDLCKEITGKMVQLNGFLPDNLVSNLNDVHGDFLHRVQEPIKDGE